MSHVRLGGSVSAEAASGSAEAECLRGNLGRVGRLSCAGPRISAAQINDICGEMFSPYHVLNITV